MDRVASANEEAIEAWNGVLYDRFVQFRDIEFVTALGPADEVIRLAGDEAEQLRSQIEAALREALSEFVGHDGVRAAASTWIVGATAPG